MNGFEDMGPQGGSRYYTPRGGLSLQGVALGLVYGVVCGLVLGVIYGFLVQYNPFIYFNVLALFGFGMALGMATWLGARQGKLRSAALAGLVGALTGVAGLYVAWVAWLRALSGRSDEGFWVIDPISLWELAKLINVEGVWSLRSWTPTGTVLWAFWGLEALVIVGLSAKVCATSSARTPFCDRCSAWAEEIVEGLEMGPVSDPEALRMALEAGDVAALEALGLESRLEGGDYSEVELSGCPSCRQVGFLNLTTVAVTVNKKGEEDKEKHELIENLILDAGGIDAVRRLETTSPTPVEEPAAQTP